MASLATIYPRPRVWKAAGHTFLVNELKIKDLAALQALVETRAPHPYDVIRSAEYPDAAAQAEALDRAFDEAEAWPPLYGSPEADAALDPVEHAVFFLLLCLSPYNPKFSDADASILLGALASDPSGSDSWAELRRVAFGMDPDMALARLADPLWGQGSGDGPTWQEAVDRLSRDHGWTYEQIGEMYLGQWRNAAAGGLKPGAAFWTAASGCDTVAEEAAERAARFAKAAPVDRGPVPESNGVSA